jgi:hypothetical protein
MNDGVAWVSALTASHDVTNWGVVMHILLLTFIAFGFAFVVILGLLSVVADLLALSRHRPPSVFDAFAEEDPDSEEAAGQESEDRNRPAMSSYALDAPATRAAVTDINAAH